MTGPIAQPTHDLIIEARANSHRVFIGRRTGDAVACLTRPYMASIAESVGGRLLLQRRIASQ
jgi:hypothetical protein